MTAELDGGAGAAWPENNPDEPSPLLSRLEKGLDALGEPFWVETVGHDQADKFAQLLTDLRRKYSTTGDGKRITSGYAYTGVEPALAWAKACSDRLYPVMKQSIESFDNRWSELRPTLGNRPFHYVSLGPGDGQKDAVVLRDLWRDHRTNVYLAVDASTEMLRLAIRDLVVREKLSRKRMLSLPWDFSLTENVCRLRRMLDAMFGDDPVLFGSLGNTLANFDDDTRLLNRLTCGLLRPQDRLLLELTTTPVLDLCCEAAAEYERSRSFGQWVTSALRRYTDLHVDQDCVRYEGSVEGDRALLIRMIYQNQTGTDIMIKLPDGDTVWFRDGDTIRLNLTRKYTKAGLDALLGDNGLHKVKGVRADFAEIEHTRPAFGMELMILRTGAPGSGVAAVPAARTMSRAEALWRPPSIA